MKVALTEITFSDNKDGPTKRRVIKTEEVCDEEYIRPLAELIFKKMKQEGLLDKYREGVKS